MVVGSDLSVSTVGAALAAVIGYDAVQMVDTDVYWVEGRPNAGDVLMRWSSVAGAVAALPTGHRVTTSIYGYGGGAYTVSSAGIFFCGSEGSTVLRASGGQVATVVPGSDHAYGDLHWVPRQGLLLAVRESTEHPQVSELVAIASGRDPTVRVLATSQGFYAAPRASPDGRRVCWLSWEQPNMPWDASSLWVAPLTRPPTSLGRDAPARLIAGGADESIFCPQWSPTGDLYFVSDRSGWWNLYRARGDRVEPVVLLDAELGVAQWELGYATYAFLDRDRLAVLAQRGPGQQLLVGEPADLRPLELPYTSIKPYLSSDGRRIALIGSSPTRLPTVAIVNPDTADIHEPSSDDATPEPVPVSPPEVFAYRTRDGGTGHGVYHPPNPWAARPPLIVRAHPGPTANTSLRLDIAAQFFSSNGFAVADIDYRGSTGYGRTYRQQLRRQWGVLDPHDCADAAWHLAEAGKADPQRMVISGASAGGYTALRALMQPDHPFTAATARSAIIDPATWRDAVPRFQAHHTDGLIGPWPQAAGTYRARSVLHNTARIRRPVLLLHGDADLIAPVASAIELATALRAIGTPCTLIVFPAQGHTLHATAAAKALEAELTHYRYAFNA
jgi:dipeptidyl aminopeptidase/acylaminoacyl peptidase